MSRTLDANKYRINIPVIKSWFENKPDANKVKEIAYIALATGVPVIIVAIYIGELYGFTPEINTTLETLMKFYGVDHVLNTKDGPPIIKE